MCISPPPHATGAPEPPQHHPPALPRPCRGLTAGSTIRTGGGEGWSGIREMHIIHPPAPQKMLEKINTVPGHIDLSWQPLSQEPGSFHRGIQWQCQGVGVANNQQKECGAFVQLAVASCRSPARIEVNLAESKGLGDGNPAPLTGQFGFIFMRIFSNVMACHGY